ncbi:MAG: putative sugar O-methyltransferase [Acidimicrobiia bacterium]|nr:putative sugar O-methyltransferase [Acidimicrobiia bacterium]
MKVLFVVASPEYLRYYDSVLRELARRGHDVSIAVNQVKEQKQARFEGVSDVVTVLGVVPPRDDRWSRLAKGVRGTIDFARYLHPDYRDAAALRDRMRRKVLPRAMRWLDRIPSLGERPLGLLTRVLGQVERGVPVSGRLTAFLDAQRPDVLVVSPLIDAASDQVDLVRAARRLGIRVAVGIASWDNLTNKGLLRVIPDLLLVWNEAQKAEAVRFHGIRPEAVAVTGAQLFDRWFERVPSRGREAFCRGVGLPDARPFLLYTASSVFIARSELELPFARTWIEALRRSADPAVRDVAVLVRPHPYNWHAWENADLGDLGPVQVWPRGPYNAIAEETRAGYFDSMFHSAGVVGLNTSAMLESAIVGRPVFSLTSGDFAGTQEGTLHFHHLLPENGGFLRVASTLDDHVAQLSQVLRDPAVAIEETRRFVASFVRPHGVDRPCTPIVADTLEAFGARPVPPPERDRPADLVTRTLLRPAAALTNLTPGSKQARKKKKKSRQTGRTAKAGREGTPGTTAAAPRDPWSTYAEVRDLVCRIKADDASGEAGVASPSAYWAGELGNIDYMIEATPLVVAKLRHHASHITGLRPYDYRVQTDEKRALFEERLRALIRLGGKKLVVPEHPALGGFGYEIDGRLFNLDTLKFLEVLVGLQRSGVLDELRGPGKRPVVWEIGAGWGGFACQFKTLVRGAVYVITDLPELFLFSATYLRTVFPSARTLIWHKGLKPAERARWREHDFVFVPNACAGELAGFDPDLLVNIASFQEMTAAQVAGYVDLAARAGCRHVYSLNRERSRYNDELTSVGDLLRERYDLTDVSPLETDYTTAMKKPARPQTTPVEEARAREALVYRHLLGRLRTVEPAAVDVHEEAAAR